jgi:hypothetical protein
LGGLFALGLILVVIVFVLRREKARNVGNSTAQGHPFSHWSHSSMGGGALGSVGAGMTGAWFSGWKRGSGRSGDTTTTAYNEDSKAAVPHLYNSYASGVPSYVMSFKGKRH